MAHHPKVAIEIVGIAEGGRGRSCEEHDVCGTVLHLDSVVRLRSIQIINDAGKEEPAVGVYWVTDGIDRCLVGFLPRHCVHHRKDFDGKLAQVVEFLGSSTSPSARQRSHRMCGSCMATIIDAE